MFDNIAAIVFESEGKRLFRWGVPVLLPFLLIGCGEPSLQNDFDEYLTRLARVLDTEQPSWFKKAEPRLAIRYPGAKARILPTTDTRVGMLEFLSLYDCDLLHLISEKNSSLGKVMSVTAQYYYQVMIYSGIEQCMAKTHNKPTDKLEPELFGKLTKILETKKNELPFHYWNATWGNPTFQQFYSFSKPLLSYDEISGFRAPAAEALNAYFKSLPQWQLSRPVDFEASLFAVHQQSETHLQAMEYHYGGRLIKTVVYGTVAIEEATRMLQQRQQKRPLCYNQKPSRQVEILHNVFIKFYVLKLQPALSKLDKEAAYLLQVNQAFSPPKQIQSTEPVIRFHRRYLDINNVDNPLQQLRHAIKEHALTWNQILRGCGLKVGGQ